jgi:cytidylate kinase
LLKDLPAVLHVRVMAPLENRLIRVRHSPIMADRKFADSVEARRAAQELIEKHDDASASYLKRFYNMDWADPGLYHLVINTENLPLETAARIVIEAARALDSA